MGAKEVDNAELSDKALVVAIRKALTSAQSGDTDRYNELVQLMYIIKKPDDVDVVAQLQTLLKILSRSVACLDEVHHKVLLDRIFGTTIWDHKPNVNVMYALLDLIVSLATTSGKHLSSCLNMLVSNLLSQPRILDNKMLELLSRVHAALHKISFLVPLAPSILLPILAQSLPSVHDKDRFQLVVPYVENLLQLENSSIGKVFGNVILRVVMERLLDLDLEIGWDDILQDDSAIAMFDMELDLAVEGTTNEGEEFPVRSLNQNGNAVSDLLDDLMVLYFDHLKSCQDSGRLDEVFENLFESFVNLILNAQKTKISQFLMFYACSLDPENCGVKFASKLLDIFLNSNNNNQVTRTNAVAYLASYLARAKFLPASFVASMLKRLVDECADYCRTCNDDARPEEHQVFYSVCQAILYLLCFRMRSILDVPRFRSQITPLESVLSHKLDPLRVCLPSVVSEFLYQAKAGGLFIVSDAFIFDDLPESELSRALGGFFPFDPCLLKKTNRLISRDFIFWETVITAYDEDDEDEVLPEVIVYGDTDSDDDDDDDDVHDNEVDKMSITPKHSFMHETERLLKMPWLIRPSTCHRESL
ncbi:RNA polymerase I-specific transcription initiation factor RRN3 [Arabidopsis lyrata subsp. lyrata]|uniref:RNA polymerase I-specific transcription initiation factor RRN3 n=1 Tax=Arabidopsis lyrata subsp. lyrata TaxID=81972 RepID=UPI000A29E874|nr:RNA polymerase I-specific transcription initiation factor RRN3 [Arabidopsis lyrata subsp. lyrata]|eukprot:XP_020884807.1 RNA polymerase I-specific transcription initiation factor RRN3 [Arabidopsis lyrata subsp. lyrata]